MKKVLFIILIFAGLVARAQQSSDVSSKTTKDEKGNALINKLNAQLKNYAATSGQGKIFLQFDKQNYSPGDTIWFKAYNLLDAGLPYHDRILYTELINKKDSVVSRITLKLDPAITWGEIPLSDDLEPAAYRIRAYVKNAEGKAAGNLFEQTLNIGVRIVNNSKALMPVNAKFYPEGGTLTVGLRSKIAVKIVDSYGYGKEVDGVITDEDNTELASFATGHGGIGVFALEPADGKKYKAVVMTNGRKLLFDLPPAVPAGFSLSVNNQLNDSIYLKVAANPELLKGQSNQSLYIIGERGDDICFSAKGELKDKVMAVKVAKNKLPSGILQFTLFTEGGKPLNSRMIFNQSNDTLTLTTDRRARQPLNIVVKDLNNKPINGSFAVAVTRESPAMPDMAENDILAYMQLTGELKNDVEQPEYYFDEQNKDTKAAMDMLLITQESKKYNWRDILAAAVEKPQIYTESALSLEGFIKNKKGEPLPGAKVWVFCIAQHFERDTLTDKNGHFKFDDLDVADTANLLIKAESKITKKFNIYVKDKAYPQVEKAENVFVAPNGMELIGDSEKNVAAYVPATLTTDTQKVYKALKQVDIKATKIADPSFFNNYNMTPTYTIHADRLQDNGPNLAKTLASKIPGATFRDGKVVATHPVIAFAVVIDGHVIPNEKLNDYVGPEDVENVKMLEGVTPTSVTGVTAGKLPPVLMITTKRYAGTAPPEGRDLKTVAIATDTSGRSMLVPTQPNTKTLKTVNIKSQKTSHDDASNDYGASQPYTISGDALRELGSDLRDGLLMKVPMAFTKNGALGRLGHGGTVIPYHIILNGRPLENDSIFFELDAVTNAADVEDVRVLHGKQYLSVYGVPPDRKYGAGDDFLIVTTKQYVGTTKPETKQMKTVSIALADTGRKTVFTADVKKPKLLKDVKITATKDNAGDFAPDAYTLKGNALTSLGGAPLMQALSMKLPSVRVKFDKDEMVDYFVAFKQTPVTIDNPAPSDVRLHVVINNAELSPQLSLDAYLNPEDVEEVKLLHGAMYKSMFNIAIDPRLYDMDDVIYIKTKPTAALGRTASLKKASQIQNESYITTADPSPILTYKFAGYSTVHKFDQGANSAQANDAQRTKTVFWQPNMITDADGKLTINMDDKPKGTYRVTVQGVDSYGRTGRLVYTYKVE